MCGYYTMILYSSLNNSLFLQVTSHTPAEVRESLEPLLTPMSSLFSRGHSLQTSPISSGPTTHSLRSRLCTDSCSTCHTTTDTQCNTQSSGNRK